MTMIIEINEQEQTASSRTEEVHCWCYTCDRRPCDGLLRNVPRGKYTEDDLSCVVCLDFYWAVPSTTCPNCGWRA